ncbi:MAG: thiamine phosphate synthase [Azonexus sp.]
MPNRLRGLYAITPENPDGERLLADVEAVLAGGCRIVQYRDKRSTPPERVARAHALRRLTRSHDALLIVNDDMALAFLAKADGLHLGHEDGNLAAARAILGPGRILGASCYADYSAAQKASRTGADYVAFGAVYPSPTKPNAQSAAVDLFFRAKSGLTAPQGHSHRGATTCAIGGITLANAPALIAAGADLLAVITDLFSAPDIAARAAAYQRLFEEAQP